LSEDQPTFQYSVKIERTAKGARHTIHVHSNDKETAIAESVAMYEDVAKRLDERGMDVAPIEVKEAGKQ
jgi:hypothetical protein